MSLLVNGRLLKKKKLWLLRGCFKCNDFNDRILVLDLWKVFGYFVEVVFKGGGNIGKFDWISSNYLYYIWWVVVKD